MIEKYYKLVQANRNQKIVYFLPFIYRYQLYQGSIHLPQQIHNIFSSCIRDETIISEFSFHF